MCVCVQLLMYVAFTSAYLSVATGKRITGSLFAFVHGCVCVCGHVCVCVHVMHY